MLYAREILTIRSQLLDPRPAYMDPPRIKTYKRTDFVIVRNYLTKSSEKILFYISLSFLTIIIVSTSVYAYILQVQYKSEKFRCETPFFHNKRDNANEIQSI